MTPKDPIEAGTQQACAAALRRLAGDAGVRMLVRNSPALERVLGAAASRFIAGPDREAALERGLALARAGVLVSLEFMGEDTVDPQEVEAATREFIQLIQDAAALRIEASVSLNLSHIGLAIDPDLARRNCERISTSGASTATEVILNMEGTTRREEILDTFWRLGPRFPVLGITLQACVEQTPDDLARALTLPGRIRLVKGAYDELGDGAIRSDSVNTRYGELADRVLRAGHRCSIATHDQFLLDHAAAQARGGTPSAFEFEMLFGVADERLLLLHDRGYQVRAYLPYGTEWLLYLCHRLAEHPLNLYRAVTEMIDRFRTGNSGLLASG